MKHSSCECPLCAYFLTAMSQREHSGSFHFLTSNLCFPTQTFSVHLSFWNTSTSAASAGCALCKCLSIHLLLFINKEDKNERRVFFYHDTEFSLSCLETGDDWQCSQWMPEHWELAAWSKQAKVLHLCSGQREVVHTQTQGIHLSDLQGHLDVVP